MNDKLEDTKPRPALNLAPDAPDAPETVEPSTPPTSAPEVSPASQTPLQAMRPVPPQMTPEQPPQMPPRPPVGPYSPVEPSGPPRWLLWGVILIFLMGMLGLIGGFVGFRFLLEPAQQERVMQVLPFMEAFLGPRPQPGDTLPTPETAGIDNLSPEDLLSGLDLRGSATEAAPTDEPVSESTPEVTAEATATPTPTNTATPEPVTPESTDTAAIQATHTAVPTVDNSMVIPRTVRLTGFNYQKQTWNNCGPANITMALSYFGWQQNQAYAATFLKPGGREDKNVSPHEMVSFVNSESALRSFFRVGGNIDILKQLLANNIPVVIESGSTPEGYEWLGHYRLLVGYDDNQGVFYILDSFVGSDNPGVGVVESYSSVDDEWHQFNRTFIVVYEPQRQELVERILGDLMDETRAAEIALEKANSEATADPTDGHAWFNIGSSLTLLGQYDRAALAFDRARVAGVPWRMMWYQFGPYEAYLGAGRVSEVISLAATNLGNGGDYVEETHYWNGRALEAQGKINEAATAYRRALGRNSQYTAAAEALAALGR